MMIYLFKTVIFQKTHHVLSPHQACQGWMGGNMAGNTMPGMGEMPGVGPREGVKVFGLLPSFRLNSHKLGSPR